MIKMIPGFRRKLSGQEWSSFEFPLGMLQVAATIRDLCELEFFDCRTEQAETEPKGIHIRHGTPLNIREHSQKVGI